VLVLVFLLGAIAVYYRSFLDTLAVGNLLGKLIVMIVLSLIPMFGSLKTLLEPADMLFLLPKEKQMNHYLNQAFIRSLILPCIVEVLIIGLLMPLIVVSTNGQLFHFVFYVIATWSMKTSYLLMEKHHLYQVRKYKSIQFIVTSLIIFALMLFVSPFIGITAILLPILLIKILPKTDKLDWEYAVLVEQKRMHGIYKFISLFTDVPEIISPVKRRKYFDFILQKIGKKHQNTYFYLFMHSFIRGSEYSGLVFRLSGIGGLFIFFIGQELPTLLIGMLFIYLIGFQLIPLYTQFDYMILTRLYPVNSVMKRKSMEKLVNSLLFFSATIFYLIGVISLKTPLAALFIAVYALEIVLFTKVYLKMRIKKMEN
jgi:ABC-2 type transport system permease protein